MNQEVSTYQFGVQSPDILDRFRILLRILNENVDDHVILAIFRSQVSSLFVVPALPTHCDGGFQIELELPRSLNERI